MILAAAAIVLVAFLWWAQRSRELFLVSFRDGRALVVRGRIPGALLSDFKDALSRAQVKRATVRGLREDHGSQLRMSGVDEWTEQRLRNIFRVYPVSNLRAATVDRQRTFGQVLGVAWLAWMLEKR
jgi:uncharacterized protein DUF3634